jgi:GT2 family glycosyltransferase
MIPGRIDIGFPCWQNRKYIETLLTSIKKFDECIHKIIVVDQGSIDGTKEYIEGLGWKNLEYIRNESNTGAWRGRNRVLDKAWEDDCEHLVVCDSDVEIRGSGWLSSMKKVMDMNPLVGVVEGLVQTRDKTFGFAGTAFCLCRMRMIREIGYFDPNFQLGGDRDFWSRIENYHWETAFCADMDVFHNYGGTTTEVLGSKRDAIIAENYKRLTNKYTSDFLNRTYGKLCQRRSEANKIVFHSTGKKITVVKGGVVQKG